MRQSHPKLTVRRAREADAFTIACVHVDSRWIAYRDILHPDALGPMAYDKYHERWSARLSDNSDIRVACTQTGHIVGFASGGAPRDQLTTYQSELYALYVRPECQGQGAGGVLLRAFIQSAHTRSESLYAWTLAHGPAPPFYRRHGGLEIATRDVPIGGIDYREVAFGYPYLGPLG